MRIVALSDTHNQHWKISVPDGDILIHAGDFSFYGAQHEINNFNEWLGTLPHQYKVLVPGNHEVGIEDSPYAAIGMLTNVNHVLINSGVEIGGIKIWGSPYTPWFGDWAFQYRRSERRGKWDAIPEALDILITHGPPNGVGDFNTREHVGCMELMLQVMARKPRHHIFGHIHESYGSWERDGTNFHNVSQLNDEYRISDRSPVIIHI